MRNRLDGARRSQEHVLHKIECVVGVRDHPPGDTEQAIEVRIEQLGEALGSDVASALRAWSFTVHALLNGRQDRFVGAASRESADTSLYMPRGRCAREHAYAGTRPRRVSHRSEPIDAFSALLLLRTAGESRQTQSLHLLVVEQALASAVDDDAATGMRSHLQQLRKRLAQLRNFSAVRVIPQRDLCFGGRARQCS